MQTEQMRAELLTAYPGRRWLDKVKKMPSQQVRAVYMRMAENNKLPNQKK